MDYVCITILRPNFNVYEVNELHIKYEIEMIKITNISKSKQNMNF